MLGRYRALVTGGQSQPGTLKPEPAPTDEYDGPAWRSNSSAPTGRGGRSVAIEKIRAGYRNLIKKWSDPPLDVTTAEEKLDALLTAANERAKAHAARGTAEAVLTPLEAFRKKLGEELIPVFDDLARKYAAQGLTLKLDATDFLSGGRKLTIEVSIQTDSLRLDGTVLENGVAFNELRSSGGVPGAIASGAMLRTRLITAEAFREFLCAQMAAFLRSILHQRR
jgi:hypothetical protein